MWYFAEKAKYYQPEKIAYDNVGLPERKRMRPLKEEPHDSGWLNDESRPRQLPVNPRNFCACESERLGYDDAMNHIAPGYPVDDLYDTSEVFYSGHRKFRADSLGDWWRDDPAYD